MMAKHLKLILLLIAIFLIKPKISYSQSEKLLDQINFFSTYEISEKIDELRLYTYNDKKKAEKAAVLSKELENIKQKCVVGFAYCSRLLKKLEYFDKQEYIVQINKIKKLYEQIFNNLLSIKTIVEKMSVNPRLYKKRTIKFLNKKMKTAQRIQLKLHKISPVLNEISKWEAMYANGNFSYN